MAPVSVWYVTVPAAAESKNPPCAICEMRTSSCDMHTALIARIERSGPPDCHAVVGSPIVAAALYSIVSHDPLAGSAGTAPAPSTPEGAGVKSWGTVRLGGEGIG